MLGLAVSGCPDQSRCSDINTVILSPLLGEGSPAMRQTVNALS